MKVLITGAAGFVGSTLIEHLLDAIPGLEVVGLDNFARPGSELNRKSLQARGAHLIHGDVRLASDFENLPPVDWVIDTAANPSVIAGVEGKASSRQLVETNLGGTINMLEFCRNHSAGFILFSSSRVYSIEPLAKLPVDVKNDAFLPSADAALLPGLSQNGIAESFSVDPPVSLYGATKLASEVLALEYGETFGFEVWINRCSNLAGPGQFGRPDQGIFSYWIHSYAHSRPLKYIGFDGKGRQVRDCLHPRDLVPLLQKQFETKGASLHRIQNFSGGTANCMSLAQLTEWCANRFPAHTVDSDPTPRPFDLPWVVLDSNRSADQFKWNPQTPIHDVLEEIAQHAKANPDWMEVSNQS